MLIDTALLVISGKRGTVRLQTVFFAGGEGDGVAAAVEGAAEGGVAAVVAGKT